MGLVSLPSELLGIILLNLDFRDLLRCRQVIGFALALHANTS